MKRPDLSPLVGMQVTRVSLDFEVTLLLAHVEGASAGDASLVIGVPFALSRIHGTGAVDPTARELRVDPATGDHLAEVVGLLRSTVTALDLSEDGGLTVAFDVGYRLHIGPQQDHEAWQISGQGVENWLQSPQ